MNIRIPRLLGRAVAVLAASVVAACGGADEASGGGAEFSIQPTEVGLKGPAPGICGSGLAGRVYVYGGVGPYRVDNTSPGAVIVSKGTLSEPGDFFDVTIAPGVCLDPALVIVVDYTGRTATLTVRAVEGDQQQP